MNEVIDKSRDLLELALLGFRLKEEIILVQHELEISQKELKKAKEEVELYKTQLNYSIKKYNELNENIKPIYFNVKKFKETVFNSETSLHYFENLFSVDPEIEQLQPANIIGNSQLESQIENSFQFGINLLALFQQTIEPQDPQAPSNMIYQNGISDNQETNLENVQTCIETNGHLVPSQVLHLQSLLLNNFESINGAVPESNDTINYNINSVSHTPIYPSVENTHNLSKTSFTFSREPNTNFDCWKNELKKID